MKKRGRAAAETREAARRAGGPGANGRASAGRPSPARGPRRASRRLLLTGLLLVGVGIGAVVGGRHIWDPRGAAVGGAGEPDGSPEEARLLKEALARPADGAAQVALGRYYEAERRPYEAVWALQRARDAAGGGPRAGTVVLLMLAAALEGGDRRERALALLSEPGLAAPGDRAVVRRRAELQYRLGRASEAVATLRPLVSGASGSGPAPDGVLLFGRVLEAAGDDPGALAQYRRALTMHSVSGEAQRRLGALLVRRGQVAAGRAALEAARRAAPADPEPPYLLGTSFLAAGQPEPGRRWLGEAVRVASGFAPARLALGRLALARGQWKPAAEQFEAALRSDRRPEALLGLADVLTAAGNRVEALKRRGLALALQGKLPRALAQFQALKTAEPDSPTAPIQISQVLIQMGRSAEAAREIEPAAARWPRDRELTQRLAQLYIDSLARDAARRVCEAWQREEPNAATPVWLLGRIASYSPNQLPQAIYLYEWALKLNPKDPEICYALADTLFRAGPRADLDRALALMGQAIALAPREANYRYHLGLMLQQLGRLEPARRQLLQALDRDPHLTAAVVALVQIAGRLGETGQVALLAPVVRELQEAERTGPPLRQATYRSPQDPAAYAVLARYLTGRGDLQAALAQWEVVLSLKPGDQVAARELARLNRVLDRA